MSDNNEKNILFGNLSIKLDTAFYNFVVFYK